MTPKPSLRSASQYSKSGCARAATAKVTSCSRPSRRAISVMRIVIPDRGEYGIHGAAIRIRIESDNNKQSIAITPNRLDARATSPGDLERTPFQGRPVLAPHRAFIHRKVVKTCFWSGVILYNMLNRRISSARGRAFRWNLAVVGDQFRGGGVYVRSNAVPVRDNGRP